MGTILDKITEETINKDIDKIMTPFTSRILAYGFILCGICLAACAYINSNLNQKSDFITWLPGWSYCSWVIILFLGFVIEKIYRKIIKKQNIIIKEKISDNELLLKQNFELQEQLAIQKLEYDKTILKETNDSRKSKWLYEQTILPIIETSKSEGVGLDKLKIFEVYLNSGILSEFFKWNDVKLVYDRFYEIYPILKPNGYETIIWENTIKKKTSF